MANIEFVNQLLHIDLADNLLHLGTGLLATLVGLPLVVSPRRSVSTA